MKSFRQFITEESTTGPQPRSPEEILKNFRKRIVRRFKIKTGREPSPKDLERIADTELEDIIRDSRGKMGERARKDVVKTQGEEDLLKKINRNRSRAFDPKGDKGKFFGKPTEVDIKYGKAKYVPPKKVDPSELTGPNTKGEIVTRRRARRRYDPDFEKVQSTIDRKEKLKQKYKYKEYDPDSIGGDPAPKKKTAKPEPGRSAKRRKPSKTVDQIKKEIEARTRTTKVKSSTIKGNKPPTLPKPTPVPGGGTAHTNPQSMLRIPRSSTSKLSSSYNKKGDSNLRKLLDRSKGKNNVLKGGGTPQVENPWKDTDYIDPPKKTEVIDQRKVSKRASQFTKDTNTERIKKLSRRRVKIDYGMPEPKKGEILRSVDKRPEVKKQLSPDTIRSTNPQSNINTTYDKSKASREASRRFKDMASDSRKKLSSTGPIGRSKEFVKNMTNKIKSSFSGVKSTPTSKTKIPKNKLFQRLNITRKKGLKTLKGTGPGAFYGLSAYTRQRDAGAGITRSTGGAVTSAATSGLVWKGVSGLLNKYAPAKGLAGQALNIGLSGAAAWKVGDETLKAYDATLGPTKGKNPPTKKDDKKVLLPFGGNKKKKKLDFKNYSFSFAGDSRMNKKDKK